MGEIAKQDQTENDGSEHLVPRRQRRSCPPFHSCTSNINHPSTIIRDTKSKGGQNKIAETPSQERIQIRGV